MSGGYTLRELIHFKSLDTVLNSISLVTLNYIIYHERFLAGEKTPALTPAWYSALRDSYGFPKSTQALNLDYMVYTEPTNAEELAEERAIVRRYAMFKEFKWRPKVLTPYSWEFINENYLYNWVNSGSNISLEELKKEDREFRRRVWRSPHELPDAPPLQVKPKSLLI